MAIQFPIPTEVGETYTEAGSTWVWDGVKWSVAMAGDTAIGAQIATPVITDPGVVDSASDLTLNSSDYEAVSGIPGAHASSHWQVSEGATPLVSTNGITAVNNVEPDPVEEVRFTLAKTTSTCGNQSSPYWRGPAYRGGMYNYNATTGTWVSGMVEQMTTNAQGGNTSCVISEDGLTTINRLSGLPTPWNGESTGPGRNIYYAGGRYYIYYDISCHANGGQCACNGNMPGSNVNAGSGWQTYIGDSPTGPWTDVTPSGQGNGGGSFRGSYGNVIYQGNFERFWRYENGGSAQNGAIPGFNTTNNQPDAIWSRNGGAATTDLGPGFAIGGDTFARNTDSTGAWSAWEDITAAVRAGGWTAGKNANSMGFFNGEYIIIGQTGNITRSSDDGVTWTSMDVAAETNLSAAWDFTNFITDGNLVYMTGIDGANSYNCWSTDLTSWIITEDNSENFHPHAWVDGLGGWVQFSSRDLGDGNWDLFTRIVGTDESPIAQTLLNIADADADGFEAGMNIENLGGSTANGTINAIDSTSVTLAPSGGTWEVITPAQRIRIPPSEFNVIIDSPRDTVNLTELTITSDLLSAGSDYAARVEYRSDGNVVSDFSDWREFTTS